MFFELLLAFGMTARVILRLKMLTAFRKYHNGLMRVQSLQTCLEMFTYTSLRGWSESRLYSAATLLLTLPDPCYHRNCQSEGARSHRCTQQEPGTTLSLAEQIVETWHHRSYLLTFSAHRRNLLNFYQSTDVIITVQVCRLMSLWE